MLSLRNFAARRGRSLLRWICSLLRYVTMPASPDHTHDASSNSLGRPQTFFTSFPRSSISATSSSRWCTANYRKTSTNAQAGCRPKSGSATRMPTTRPDSRRGTSITSTANWSRRTSRCSWAPVLRRFSGRVARGGVTFRFRTTTGRPRLPGASKGTKAKMWRWQESRRR